MELTLCLKCKHCDNTMRQPYEPGSKQIFECKNCGAVSTFAWRNPSFNSDANALAHAARLGMHPHSPQVGPAAGE